MKQNLFSLAGNDLILNIYDVQSGSQWISLGWNLSEPRCEYALTGLNLKVTDLGQNNQDIAVVDVPKSCSGCNNSLYRSSCSLNITKNSEGCPSVPVVACSHYQITLYPKIWDVPYRQFTATNSAKTTPGTIIMSFKNVIDRVNTDFSVILLLFFIPHQIKV